MQKYINLLRTLNWNDLKFFLEVARCGRVTSAAKRLGVDYTTVSRRIASLESTLETLLFEKSRNSGFHLTSEGAELWSNLVYEHQAVFLSDCSITCSPSWNLTLLTTRVSS